MWLLTSEVPISLAGVVTWPRRTASRQVPPTVWFLSMQCPASSSSSSNLNPISSGPLHIINQSASFTLSSLLTTTMSTGAAFGLHSLAILPLNKSRGNLQVPLPTSHQATSYLQHLHHVANPCCNSTSLTISLASLRHFYLVQMPQK